MRQQFPHAALRSGKSRFFSIFEAVCKMRGSKAVLGVVCAVLQGETPLPPQFCNYLALFLRPFGVPVVFLPVRGFGRYCALHPCLGSGRPCGAYVGSISEGAMTTSRGGVATSSRAQR